MALSLASQQAIFVVCLAGMTASCRERTAAEKVEIDEASGIAYHRGDLYVVDDSVNGAYYRIPLKGQNLTPSLALNEMNPLRVELPKVGILVDLEGLDFLADGRIVLLSERIHSLIGEDGLIVEYDYPLGEVGRRGLEGVAVRRLPDGTSRLAAIWEGGYPESGSLHPFVEKRVNMMPFPPLIFVHDLKPGERKGRIRMKDGILTMTLNVPKPDGDEPTAQRFRAPDLVWYRWPSEPEEWGFIVLLSSQNAAGAPAFLNHWLQRFDMNGKPAGPPIDIAAHAPAPIGHANWEGLGWFIPGKSLVLVHEGAGKLGPHAYIMELPSDWQTTM
jgi:hypothetical protein